MRKLINAKTRLVQHNIITNARYEMSALEMDIFFILLSKVKKDDKPRTFYRIYVREVEHITGRVWNYQQFKEATERFGSRVFEVDVAKDRLLQLWMLASVEYVLGEGYLEVEISEKARPYLIELKENFTVYDLYHALSLTSKYAKRLYQIASQWKDIGRKIFTIDELKVMLHLKDPKGKEPEQYKQIGELKKFVLEVAKEQITRLTDLDFDYRLLKRGRSFHEIEIFIKIKPRPVKHSKRETPQLPPTTTKRAAPQEEKFGIEQLSWQLSRQDYWHLLQKSTDIRHLQAADEVQLAQMAKDMFGEQLVVLKQDIISKKQRAVAQLQAMGISKAALIQEIIDQHLYEYFRLYYDWQTGKIKADNPAGYFLHALGVK